MRLGQEREFFNSFRPPVGSFFKGDPVLIAKKAEEKRNAELAAERKRIKPGLVYKPLKYWQDSMGSANYLEWEIALTLKNIFDGAFEEIKLKDLDDRRLIYLNYVRAFDRHCRRYIKKPIAKAIVTEETNRFGEVSRDQGQSFHVEAKFSEKFDEYYDWRKKWYIKEATRRAMSGKIMGGSTLLHHNIMDNVVSTIKCDSATMKQFSENLWRVTHQKKSLQKTGGSIPGAEAESEIPNELR